MLFQFWALVLCPRETSYGLSSGDHPPPPPPLRNVTHFFRYLSLVFTSDISISIITNDKFSSDVTKTKQKGFFFNLLLFCHSLCSYSYACACACAYVDAHVIIIILLLLFIYFLPVVIKKKNNYMKIELKYLQE